MLPGDRIICAFVYELPEGAKFKDWPIHITLVPWFRLDVASPLLAEQMQKYYIDRKAFRIEVLEEAKFGYKKQKVVNLVASPELIKLEDQTRRLLHYKKAWIVDEADRTRLGFRPHVTALKTGRVNNGENFWCDRLYIVSQRGTFKQIDSVVRLF